MKGKSVKLHQQEFTPEVDSKQTTGLRKSKPNDKEFDQANKSPSVKKKNSKLQDPPNSNTTEMKTKREKEDLKVRGKTNQQDDKTKQSKDNQKTSKKDEQKISKDNQKVNKDNQKSNKDNQKSNKDNQKANKGNEKNPPNSKSNQKVGRDNQKNKDLNDIKGNENKQPAVKGKKGKSHVYSKDDTQIEIDKKRLARVNKAIQTDKSTLKSRDDHDVNYGRRHDTKYGSITDSERYGYADSESDYYQDFEVKRGYRSFFTSQKYYATATEKPLPLLKPSSKPKARFGTFEFDEAPPKTAQSRGVVERKFYDFQDGEEKYGGPQYIRSKFSAKSGNRDPTTLSMYSVRSSRVIDDDAELEELDREIERSDSKWSDRDRYNGVDGDNAELIDLEQSLPSGAILGNGFRGNYENGDINGIDERNPEQYVENESRQVDILKITTPPESAVNQIENGESPRYQISNRVENSESAENQLENGACTENGVEYREYTENKVDNGEYTENKAENGDKAENLMEKEEIRMEKGEYYVDKENDETIESVIQTENDANTENLEERLKALKSNESPVMSSSVLQTARGPDQTVNEKKDGRFSDQEPIENTSRKPGESYEERSDTRRSQRFPSKDGVLPINQPPKQRNPNQSNSFRGRSRNPIRRFNTKPTQKPEGKTEVQEKNDPKYATRRNRVMKKGAQSLDRNVGKPIKKEDQRDIQLHSPIRDSFTPRPPSGRRRSHDGRYSVDSLDNNRHLSKDDNNLHGPDTNRPNQEKDDGVREDSLERPALFARDSLDDLDKAYESQTNRVGEDRGSEEENNQYSYGNYEYGTSIQTSQPDRGNGEMLEQSADELKTTVEELEKRFDAIENEGNEWKTRFETQTEMNQQLERQILMLENKVEESKKNLKDAGKSPQEGQLFIDLADANPQMVKQLEKEKMSLINQIRDLEWRLDQESKAYHRANDERKQYVIEIQSTKGNLYQIQRQRAAAGDATYRTPRENGGNIPDDQRILDPKKGPIKKTAGVKQLPSLDSV